MRLIVLVFCLAGPAGACATTQPWEREDLARPTMRLDDDPGFEALMGHVQSTREGAVGGFGRGGGGCGCN